jgi:hypothetical protein
VFESGESVPFTVIKELADRPPLALFKDEDFRKAGRHVFWKEVGCDEPLRFDTMEQALTWLEAFLKYFDHVPRKWMRVADLEEVRRLEAARIPYKL